MKQLDSKIMQTGWASMLEQVIPGDTHPDLVKTYKRFFFAGAKHLLDTLLYSAELDESMEPTENDLSKVDALQHEINAFFTEVSSGRQ